MLPFTVDEFFAVFGAYNTATWPAPVLAYGLAAMVVLTTACQYRCAGRVGGIVLSIFWLWNGLAYHLAYFTQINPAAYAFAALFVVQGVVYVIYGLLLDRLALRFRADVQSIAGAVLIIYAALGYELLGFLSGHGWPQAPLFGVAPCPMTIFTLGVLLLNNNPLSPWFVTIPLVWAGIGTTAAVLLTVPEDLGLGAAGIVTLILLRRTKACGKLERSCRERKLVP